MAQAVYELDVTIEAPPVCPGLDKTADPPSGTEVEQGDVITYTITVQNVGTDAVVDETVVDTLPEGVELIESSVDPEADFDEAEGTLTWTIDLPAGSGGEPSRLVLTYQVEVTTDEGTLMNEARWVERDLTVADVASREPAAHRADGATAAADRCRERLRHGRCRSAAAQRWGAGHARRASSPARGVIQEG